MSGRLDDRRVFQLVERLGYAGHIGCEYNPAAGTLAGLGWMKALSSKVYGRAGANLLTASHKPLRYTAPNARS